MHPGGADSRGDGPVDATGERLPEAVVARTNGRRFGGRDGRQPEHDPYADAAGADQAEALERRRTAELRGAVLLPQGRPADPRAGHGPHAAALGLEEVISTAGAVAA